MKNISIIEINNEKVIQYMHSDNPEAINLQVNQETYDQIQDMTKTKDWIKTLIDVILLQPNSIKNKDLSINNL